jgi:hypothetical protein
MVLIHWKLCQEICSVVQQKNIETKFIAGGGGEQREGGGTVSYLVVDSTGAHQSTDAGVQKVRVYILGLKKVLAF